MNLRVFADAAAAAALIAGTLFMSLGAIGLMRFPDFYTRAQAASKAATLGLMMVFLAVAMHFWELSTGSQAFGVMLFAFLSTPVAAHVVTLVAHDAKTPLWPQGAPDELSQDEEKPATAYDEGVTRPPSPRSS